MTDKGNFSLRQVPSPISVNPPPTLTMTLPLRAFHQEKRTKPTSNRPARKRLSKDKTTKTRQINTQLQDNQQIDMWQKGYFWEQIKQKREKEEHRVKKALKDVVKMIAEATAMIRKLDALKELRLARKIQQNASDLGETNFNNKIGLCCFYYFFS